MCSTLSRWLLVLLLVSFPLCSFAEDQQIMIYESELKELENLLQSLKTSVNLLQTQLTESKMEQEKLRTELQTLSILQETSKETLTKLNLSLTELENDLNKEIGSKKAWRITGLVVGVLGILGTMGGIYIW